MGKNRFSFWSKFNGVDLLNLMAQLDYYDLRSNSVQLSYSSFFLSPNFSP